MNEKNEEVINEWIESEEEINGNSKGLIKYEKYFYIGFRQYFHMSFVLMLKGNRVSMYLAQLIILIGKKHLKRTR